jgi:hypothetical protein
MLRHLFILARDASALVDRLTITLDRHLARGEQIELVEDRRSPPSEASVPRWPAGRERRRASAHADQLRTQGYAIISREDEAAVPAPRAFEPILVAPRERARAAPRDERRALRDRLSDDLDEDLDVRDDFDDRDDFLRPRRGGRLVVAFVVVGVLAVGLYYFSTQSLDRILAGVLNAPRSTAETAARADRAIEERARAGLDAADRLAPAPPPAGPTSATPAPPIPPDATASTAAPSAATPVPTTPAPEAPRPVAAPTAKAAPAATASRDLPASPSLPPRRAEAPAPERSPDPAPQPVRSQTQTLPVFPGLPRVEIMRAASPEGTTFTVWLADPRGRPLPDAEVWLRQQSTDGFVRETKLEPVSPAGSYRAAVPTDGRRPGPLTLRVLLGDRRVEMPVAD